MRSKEERHKKYQVIIDKSELPRQVVNVEDAFMGVAREKGTQSITIDDFIAALARHTQIGCDNPMIETFAVVQLEAVKNEVREMGKALGMNITELSHSLSP